MNSGSAARENLRNAAVPLSPLADKMRGVLFAFWQPFRFRKTCLSHCDRLLSFFPDVHFPDGPLCSRFWTKQLSGFPPKTTLFGSYQPTETSQSACHRKQPHCFRSRNSDSHNQGPFEFIWDFWSENRICISQVGLWEPIPFLTTAPLIQDDHAKKCTVVSRVRVTRPLASTTAQMKTRKTLTKIWGLPGTSVLVLSSAWATKKVMPIEANLLFSPLTGLTFLCSKRPRQRRNVQDDSCFSWRTKDLSPLEVNLSVFRKREMHSLMSNARVTHQRDV